MNMAPKDTNAQTQNLLNAFTAEQDRKRDQDFRDKVLSGLTGLNQKVDSFIGTQQSMTGELFERVNHLEVNGCGKSNIHEDHETRLRAGRTFRYASTKLKQLQEAINKVEMMKREIGK